ncbi:inositol-pentakisphosphate 2-kinase [Syncephalis plumigaleata]|nr:inositol-pentakisphosphate 2-kinase [Syncephalis plumigaleata]
MSLLIRFLSLLDYRAVKLYCVRLYVLFIPELSASDWKYRAEGNANICFAYNGGNQRLRSTILRLRKRDTQLFYRQNVVAPLMGAEYVGDMHLVKVNTVFLQALSQSCHSLRPASRRNREIDTDQPYGLLTLDHASFATMTMSSLTFELKPKWGFLPDSTVSHAHLIHPEKFRTCRFCMHQHWKAEKHVMNNATTTSELALGWTSTRYCPLDLFSGDRERVHAALSALLECPQNNLRVWKTVSSNDDNPSDKVLVIGNIGSDYTNQSGIRIQLLINSIIMASVVDILLKEEILPRLRQHQQRLDEPGIELVLQYYKDHIGTAGILQATMMLWIYGSVHSVITSNALIRLCTLKDCTLLLTIGVADNNETKSIDEHVFTENIQCHSSSTTTTTIDQSEAISINDTIYYYKLCLIDLDIKPLNRIPDYHKLDKNILDAYLRSDTRRDCR